MHTDPENADLATYEWTPSDDAALFRYEVRQSPGPEYDADAASTIGVVLPNAPATFTTNAGLETPGVSSSVKVYVVLETGNEAGSNTVVLTQM